MRKNSVRIYCFYLIFLIIFNFNGILLPQVVKSLPEPAVAQNKVTIDEKRGQINKILERKFTFQDLPDYVVSNQKKVFLEGIGIELLENLTVNFHNSDKYAESLYMLGDYYYGKKNYKKSVVFFEKYVEKMGIEGKTKEVRFKLGKAYKKLKKYREAIINFYKVLDLYGKTEYTYDAYMEVADCYNIQDDTRKLIVTYENAASYFNDINIISECWLRIAKLHIKNENYFEAIWNLKKVTDKYKDSANYYEAVFLLAICYGKTGEKDREQELLKKVVSTHSFDNKFENAALYELAESHYRNNEHKEASIAYFTFLKRDSDSSKTVTALYNLAMCYLNIGIPESALDAFNKLAKFELEDEKMKSVLFFIGEIYVNLRDYKKAVEPLEKLVSQSSQEPNLKAVYYLGLCYYETKEYRKSFECFLVTEHQNQNIVIKAKGMYMLGKILVALKKFDSSTHYFKSSIQIINSVILDKSGGDEKKQKINDKDLESVSEIKKEALFALANGYFDRFEYEKAVENYQNIVDICGISQDQAWVLYKIGKCYENLKNFDKAKETYAQLQAKYPESEVAKQSVWDIKNIEWERKRVKKQK